MKYYVLKYLTSYIKNSYKIIKSIKRVENSTILIEFEKNHKIYFDLNKGKSLIYKNDQPLVITKDFIAPFDKILIKTFSNCVIENVLLHNDDKIIRFYIQSKSSYKYNKAILHLEFTGKHTNIIILNGDEIVLEALRHINQLHSSRVVKVGQKLQDIPKKGFVPKIEEIDDIEKLLYNNFQNREENSILNIKKTKIIQLQKDKDKIDYILNKLPKKEDLEKESKDCYDNANLLLVNLNNIKPYDKELVVNNLDNNKITIQLDPKININLYINKLFNKAKKLKQKSKSIFIQKDNLIQKKSFLLTMINSINGSNTLNEIEFLSPKRDKNRSRSKKIVNYHSFFFNGYKIMLGINQKSNIYLLKNSKSTDFWFHLQNINSSHVIVQNSKKNIPYDVIKKAAHLCVQFSTKFQGAYLVDFTQRRNIKIQNGSNVTYNLYDTVGIKI